MALGVQHSESKSDDESNTDTASKQTDFLQKWGKTPTFDVKRVKQYFTNKNNCNLKRDDPQSHKSEFICYSYGNTIDLNVEILGNRMLISAIKKYKWPKGVNIEDLEMEDWKKHVGKFEYAVSIGTPAIAELIFISNGVFLQDNKPKYVSGTRIMQNVFKPLVIATAPDMVGITDMAGFRCKFGKQVSQSVFIYKFHIYIETKVMETSNYFLIHSSWQLMNQLKALNNIGIRFRRLTNQSRYILLPGIKHKG